MAELISEKIEYQGKLYELQKASHFKLSDERAAISLFYAELPKDKYRQGKLWTSPTELQKDQP